MQGSVILSKGFAAGRRQDEGSNEGREGEESEGGESRGRDEQCGEPDEEDEYGWGTEAKKHTEEKSVQTDWQDLFRVRTVREQKGESNREGDDRDSEEEGEYDWNAEAQKPAGEKGIQSRCQRWSSCQIRFREMVWEQRDGRWWGKWRWTEREERDEWEQRMEDQRERAIRAWDATDAPQEVLLRVIECLVVPHLSAVREAGAAAKIRGYTTPVEELAKLALVCRAWYNLIAPALYNGLKVTDKVIGHPLRQSVAQHARSIRIHGDRPMLASARMAQSAPRPSPAMRLQWYGTSRGDARRDAAYHPSHAVIYAQVHRSYPSVVTLVLHDCNFLSSSDLLRLLASFSALERVYLSSVSVARVTDSVVRRGRPSANLIQAISADRDCVPPGLPIVTHCWTWPRKPSNHQAPVFHGLLLAEQRLVACVYELVTKSSTWYRLDAMDSDGRTCEQHVSFHYDTSPPEMLSIGCINRGGFGAQQRLY